MGPKEKGGDEHENTEKSEERQEHDTKVEV